MSKLRWTRAPVADARARLRLQGVTWTRCDPDPTLTARAAVPPLAFSPADPSRIARVDARCPTFHRATVGGATAYELAVCCPASRCGSLNA